MMATRDEDIDVHARLKALHDEAGGRLTPDAVVFDAQAEDSPLHGHFDWDDSTAGHKYRLDQARTLIRSVTLVFRNSKTTIRSPYYVKDPAAAHHEQGYVSVSVVRRDRDLAREVAVAEFSMAAAAMRRAASVARALDFADEIDGLIAAVVDLRDRVEVGEKRAH